MKRRNMNTGFHYIGLTAMAIGLAATTIGSAPVAAADVELRSEAVPQSSVVRLGDVANVKAADQQEADRLASLPLVPAPAPGTHRFLRMREVQDLLSAHGEGMSELNFQGAILVQVNPARVGKPTVVAAHLGRTRSDREAIWAGTVSPATAKLPEMVVPQTKPAAPVASAAQIEEVQAILNRLVIEYLSRTSGRKAQWRASFRVDVSDVAKLLAAKSPLECSGGGSPWTGKQRLAISFTGDKGLTRVAVYADVTATEPIVVAVQPIERGHVLTAADVEVQQSENAPALRGREPVDSVESLIGMEAMRSIQAGDPVVLGDVRSPLLVKRGQEIAVYARGGGIQVRTIARAREDGARGELIGVESLEEKEPFDAVVTGVGEAVVFSGSPTPVDEKVVQRPFSKLRQKK
jgi:flagellar basal body P-ring formation protein FlgA